jgi:hypothetical protein
MGKEDPVKEVKASAFNWLFTAFYGVLAWLIVDMRADVKMLMLALPKIEMRVDRLEDNRIVDRYRVHELMQGKHEEQITLDTLTKQ